MRKLNCRPGDLAIIVEAHNTCNIGTIVQVLHKHHNQSSVCANPDDFVWMVQAPHPMAYECNGKLIYRRKGGAPDSGLKPIRGLPLGKDITDGLRDKYEIEHDGLHVFEVSESGTISDPDVEAPKINADLFEFDYDKTVESLIKTIERCQPLLYAIQQLAQEKQVELSEDDADTCDLKNALLDEDFGWIHWIRSEGENGLDWFINYIDDVWLQQPIDWGFVDYFPNHYSGVAVAKQYFEELDGDTLDALGVDIIEGEHPGSSYYAAELRQDIDHANQVARDMRLDLRFRGLTS